MSVTLYASGGSGGHLAPAIALAQRELESGSAKKVWVCTTTKKVDQRLQQQYNTLNFRAFSSSPLIGNPLSKAVALLKNLMGAVDAVRFMHTFRFESVFVTGGFGCVPVIIAALLLGIPISMHESNSVPGKVSRWFRVVLRRFYVTRLFQEERRRFPNLRVVGFPLRKDFVCLERRLAKRKIEVDEGKPLITIFGGSQGAKTLTEAAEKNCNRWSNSGFQVVCVTGPTNYVPVEESKLNCKFLRFVDDMGALLSATDVLVARSGAGSIAEIAEARCPTILVPLPSAADDHQRWNANAFSRAGCAEVLEEVDLSVLGERVQMLIKDLKKRKHLQIAMEQWSSRNRVGPKVRDEGIETKE